MAKRKRRKDRSSERDNKSIASSNLLTNTVYSLLSDIEDRRQYNPSRYAAARGLSKGSAFVQAGEARGSRSSKKFAPDVFRFTRPNNVAVCVRRQRRKEVLFALKRTGKGSKSRRHRNSLSDVSCK